MEPLRDLRVSLSEELAAVVSVAMPDKNPTVKELLGEWYRKGEFSMAPCLSVWPCKVHAYCRYLCHEFVISLDGKGIRLSMKDGRAEKLHV